MMPEEIFRPRDFIYINNQKLDSYFSQLYGGLIQNIDLKEDKGEEGNKKIAVSAEVASKFGLGTGAFKLANFLLGQIGNIDASVKGSLQGELAHKKINSFSLSSSGTLEHFKYALFEQSLSNLGYLIDLDEFIRTKPSTDAGVIRHNLRSSDFIKFKASSIKLSDYRNAGDLIKLMKRIVDVCV